VSNRRFLDHDDFLGLTEYFTYDDETDGFTIETVQDVEPLVELNKALWNNTEKHTQYGDLTRVASIPPVVMMELSKSGIVTPAGRVLDQKKFRAWLNDSANRCFRTRAGKV
jgi:hypothetical protein